MANETRADEALNLAIKFHEKGRLKDAEQKYIHVLGIDSNNVTALHFLGVLRYQQARYREASQLIGAALRVNPKLPEAWSNYGLALQSVGQLTAAVNAFDRSLQLAPTNPDTLSNRGNIRLMLGRQSDALSDFDAALAINPRHANCLINRGNALRILSRLDEAMNSFDLAMAIAPNHPDALNGRAATLRDLCRYPDALEHVNRALMARPNFAEALSNRGTILQDMGLHEEALAAFQAAIDQKPNDATIHNNIGSLLHKECRFREALINFEVALEIAPGSLPGLYHRGLALLSLGRPNEATAAFDQVLEQDPTHPHAFGALATAIIRACDWERSKQIKKQLPSRIAEGVIIPPLTLLAYGLDAEQQMSGTATFVAKSIKTKTLFERRALHRSEKIRLAYISGDFHEHATAYLATEVFERHDRSRFDIMAISYGPDDRGPTRNRLKAALWPRFHDVRRRSDDEVAQFLLDQAVDIAVDLKGHTLDARPGILAGRPVPIAVNYLGYPSTLGMSSIDYIIADRTTLPISDQQFYSERIVHLPVAYQPRDTKLSLLESRSSRSDFGLPQNAFVYCCFNNGWKIDRSIFDIWMRLLRSVPDSVLWLLDDNADASANLRKSAQSRGIEPTRLVFSGRIPLPQHLERHVHADLFLDTLPYNAHTTASDALWSGVPLITCPGSSFAGRVAASLLTTMGLPELVARDLTDYESLALTLAHERGQLSDIRKKLALRRDHSPLFRMDQFTQYLEMAYCKMIEIAVAGNAPRSFAVPQFLT